MIEGTIAIRYARALMSLAKENKQIDQYGEQLKNFVECCEVYPDLLTTLCAKGLNLNNRERIIDDLSKKCGFHDHIKNFLKLLLDKSRIELISLIDEEYRKMANEELNRCPMTVTSAVELPQDQYDQLVKHFGQKNKMEMILTKEIEPDVLGGLRVRVGDNIYDYTLSRQLDVLKQNMMA